MSHLHDSIEDLNRSLIELEHETRYQPYPPLCGSFQPALSLSESRDSGKKPASIRNFPDLPETENESVSKSLAASIPFFGLLMSFLSVICFSLCSLIVKILTDLHALEILTIRSMFQIIFYLTAMLIYRLPFFGISGHRIDIALRAIFGSIAAITIYMSYRLIPLADASTIQFSAPVFVFILAYFILGEKVTIWQLFTGFLALVGVVFVSKPQFILKVFDPETLVKVDYTGIILAIIAAVSTAFGMIMLRKLKQTPVHVVIFWFSVVTTVSSFGTLYFINNGFTVPRGYKTWAWLIAIGFCGIGDQLAMTIAFKYEQAGVVSVSRTMTIVLAFAWDTLLLGAVAHWTSILGSCLVITAVVLLGISKTIYTKSKVVTKIFSKVNHIKEKGTEDERAKLLSHWNA